MTARILPPAERVAALFRRTPLRLAPTPGGGPADAPLERGWFFGADEAAAAGAALIGTLVRRGAAFGGSWPHLVMDGSVLAPAVPVVVRSEPAAGPDGVYRLDGDVVLREAVGAEEPFLDLRPPASPAAGAVPDLVWFGAGERYVVRGPALVIEDLFCRVEAPVDRGFLEELVVRSGRHPAALIDGLPAAGAPPAARITVRRHLELIGGDWRDPALVLAVREGVRRGRRRGDRVELELETGDRAEWRVTETSAGWRAGLIAGEHPWLAAGCEAEGGVLSFSVRPTPALDPRRPGVRARLAFDLVSDLRCLA